jgi:uncharacterized membrane protein YeiB
MNEKYERQVAKILIAFCLANAISLFSLLFGWGVKFQSDEKFWYVLYRHEETVTDKILRWF